MIPLLLMFEVVHNLLVDDLGLSGSMIFMNTPDLIPMIQYSVYCTPNFCVWNGTVSVVDLEMSRATESQVEKQAEIKSISIYCIGSFTVSPQLLILISNLLRFWRNFRVNWSLEVSLHGSPQGHISKSVYHKPSSNRDHIYF